MKKLRDKLINLLGGYTYEDVMIRTRPERTYISRFSIRTLKVNQMFMKEVLEVHPNYEEYVRKDLAYVIGDKMLEEGLIEFMSKTEKPEQIVLTALAKIVVPTGVSE